MFTRELNATMQSHYGHAGPEFVRYLLQQRHQWDDFSRVLQPRDRMLRICCK
jgi:hypothetical protein